MKYTIEIAVTLICDLMLLYADMIMTGNPELWLAIHTIGYLELEWLLENSVEIKSSKE